MDDFARHYAILKVTGEIEWKALRSRYKRLIGQWHPDRFQSDAPERELAEEHSKQITLAYQALERYYRDHGVLPRVASPRSPEPPPVGRPSSAPESPVQAERSAADMRRDGAAKAESKRGRFVLILLSSIVMAAFAVYRYSDVEERSRAAIDTDDSRDEEAASSAPTGDVAPAGGISAGSTLGEVYAIQGIPTRTEGDVWHYGKSSIRFVQGKVVSWTQDPANPLRIARDQPVQLREGLFDVGSTKDEVRSIQGTPVTETENVWDYGPSRVYFEHNRVVRWETSPLHPLHVAR
jgi:hypothetical protein